MNNFFTVKGDKILINVYVNPNAKKDEISGLYNNALKIKISSPAIDGKANKNLINFLAKFFEISKNKVSIEKGEKSKNKVVAINMVNDEIIKKLEEVANANL